MSRRKTTERYAAIRQSFWRHAEMSALSPGAAGVYARGLSYCADCMTDGFVPEHMALGAMAHGQRAIIKELVDAGHWEVAEGGYRVANYLDHNKSKEELESIKEARSKAGKSGGEAKAKPKANAKAKRAAKGVANAKAKPQQDADEEPSKGSGANLATTDVDLDLILNPPNPPEEEAGKSTPPDPPDPPDPLEALKAKIVSLANREDPTPEAAWRLIDLLSQRHGPSPGARLVDPGMCSEADKKRMAQVISKAQEIRLQCGNKPTVMSIIAEEWRSLQRLVEHGECRPDAPAIYFWKRFGGLRDEVLEKGLDPSIQGAA